MSTKAGRALLFAALAGVASCQSGLMSVVLDLPPAAPRADSALVSRAVVPLGPGFYVPVDTVRPPIESTLDPDSTVNLLPRDNAGNIDWMEALRRGVVKPRSATPGDSAAGPPSSFEFGFDFYFPGPNPTFDAYFPHSAHTEWVACEHCHTRIFRYRDTEIQMADVLEGRYCGECHGKVAFPVVTGCERCHTDFPQPADRAQPDLIGDIVMKRVQPEPAEVLADPPAAVDPGAVDSVSAAPPPTRGRIEVVMSLPEATFPHWVHRIRYQCKACHLEVFEPRAGANAVTMRDIDEGRACGVCHDGQTAFDAGFNECHRCHRSQEEGAAAGGS